MLRITNSQGVMDLTPRMSSGNQGYIMMLWIVKDNSVSPHVPHLGRLPFAFDRNS